MTREQVINNLIQAVNLVDAAFWDADFLDDKTQLALMKAAGSIQAAADAVNGFDLLTEVLNHE